MNSAIPVVLALVSAGLIFTCLKELITELMISHEMEIV
tara:strand:- start:335 stop:448 length:114 start_codon:yes stop_codon:yes gene_type:complete